MLKILKCKNVKKFNFYFILFTLYLYTGLMHIEIVLAFKYKTNQKYSITALS